ncbi:hypothetical protein [Enterobacter soli]
MGLFYNLHRYYEPRNGCYITPDPVSLAGGLTGMRTLMAIRSDIQIRSG